MADKEKKVVSGSKVEKATTEESKAAEKVAKAAKGSNKKDKPNFFVRSGKSAKKFFKDFKGECKKIDWPNAQTILKSTGVVLLVVAIVSVFVFALDFGLKEGIEGLKYLAVGEVETTEGTTETAGEHDHDHDHEEETTKAKEEDTTKADEKTTEAKDETTTEAEKTTAEKAE